MSDLVAAQRGRWGVGAFFAANGFVMGAWAPQIPLLMPRHQITESVIGLLIFGLGLGAVLSMLFAGRMIGRFGSRRVARWLAFAAVPSLPLIVLSPSLPLLALAMVLMGGLIGCMDVAMNANAVEVERRLGRAIMSSSHGFWSLGGFVGAIAGSFIIAHWNAQAAAYASAGVALLVLLWGSPRLIDCPADKLSPAQGQSPVRAGRAHLIPRDLALWVLGAMALFSMIPEGAVLDWAAIYLESELGSDQFALGLAFGFFSGAMAVMRFLGDGVRNRFGAVNTLRASAALGAAGIMMAALAPNEWIAISCFGIAGLGIANMVPIMFSAAGNHESIASAQAISTVTMVGYAGILVAPAPIGYVGDHIGFRLTFAVLALLLVVVAAMAGRAAAADNLRKSDEAPGPQA